MSSLAHFNLSSSLPIIYHSGAITLRSSRSRPSTCGSGSSSSASSATAACSGATASTGPQLRPPPGEEGGLRAFAARFDIVLPDGERTEAAALARLEHTHPEDEDIEEFAETLALFVERCNDEDVSVARVTADDETEYGLLVELVGAFADAGGGLRILSVLSGSTIRSIEAAAQQANQNVEDEVPSGGSEGHGIEACFGKKRPRRVLHEFSEAVDRSDDLVGCGVVV